MMEFEREGGNNVFDQPIRDKYGSSGQIRLGIGHRGPWWYVRITVDAVSLTGANSISERESKKKELAACRNAIFAMMDF